MNLTTTPHSARPASEDRPGIVLGGPGRAAIRELGTPLPPDRMRAALVGLCEEALAPEEGVVGAAIVGLLDREQQPCVLGTAGTTIAADIELAQAEGPGPACASIATGRPVVMTVATSRDLWPAWSGALDAAGVRSFVALPIGLRPCLGAFVVTSTRAGLTAAQDDRADLLIDVARGLLDRWATRRGMDRALASRSAIAYAIGIVMAQHDLDEDRATALLKDISSRRNQPLRDLARQIVRDRRLQPES